MSHVVTSFETGMISNSDSQEFINQVQASGLVGWEVKGLSNTTSPQTDSNGVNQWTIVWCALLQRPIKTADADGRWTFGG
jgi:hypothetical protein